MSPPEKNTSPIVTKLVGDVLIINKNLTRATSEGSQGFADARANTLELLVDVDFPRFAVLGARISLAVDLI